jgi:hypothetical protein
MTCAEDIEQTRMKIAQHYGELDTATGQYVIKKDNLETAKKELFDLFSIEQDLDIKTFSIDDLADIQLTPMAMQGLMFMIED